MHRVVCVFVCDGGYGIYVKKNSLLYNSVYIVPAHMDELVRKYNNNILLFIIIN